MNGQVKADIEQYELIKDYTYTQMMYQLGEQRNYTAVT